MIPVLLIAVPLLTGLVAFFFKNEKGVRAFVLFSSLVTVAISIVGTAVLKDPKYLYYSCDWLPNIGSSFSVKLDGMSQLLTLLTAVSYPIILLATWNSFFKKPNNFFALMLLAQAGLMGVFLAMDALLFYFFWELALIPVYFLCSQWGGERRIAVTFKFFVYTFLGSILMLVGILYVYSHTVERSFSYEAFTTLKIMGKSQTWVFWLFFLAFAIKMPIFPFHTWQPDTYEQSPTTVTMVLSGIMVKMGVFGLLRWLFPILPDASFLWGDTIATLAVIGMLYASLLAMRQDDIKRLVAYSSIAHIGLMCIAIFSVNEMAIQGVMIQMFNHGINIIGLWVIVELIERQTGTRKMSELGGLAQKAPVLAIFFVIIALANIALPLTNAFVGEFLMFTGIFNSVATQYNIWLTAFAGICIILAAVYTLNMLRKVLYGEQSIAVVNVKDIRLNEKIALGVIVIFIFWMGVYAQPWLNMTDDVSAKVTNDILKRPEIIPYLRK